MSDQEPLDPDSIFLGTEAQDRTEAEAMKKIAKQHGLPSYKDVLEANKPKEGEPDIIEQEFERAKEEIRKSN